MKSILKQECIPVGCVPPASVAVSERGVCPGGSAWQGVSSCQGGVCLPGGVYLPGGDCPGGLCQGGVCPGRGVCHTPPVNRMTDRRVIKHYLPATSFAGRNNKWTLERHQWIKWYTPRPPAWASIKDAPTGVPVFKPRSRAACSVSPFPHGSPGLCAVLPETNPVDSLGT